MLKKFLSKSFRRKAGFTLIELLVVVAILGVLAAVVVPNVGKFIGSGKIEALNTEVSNVETAITAFMADNSGSAPPSGDVTVATGIGNYITRAPQAAYTWDTTGKLTAGTLTGYTWSATTGKWTKS
jgi:type IV pilus assembly protein PilA